MKNVLFLSFLFLACLPTAQGQDNSLVHTFDFKAYKVNFSSDGDCIVIGLNKDFGMVTIDTQTKEKIEETTALFYRNSFKNTIILYSPLSKEAVMYNPKTLHCELFLGLEKRIAYEIKAISPDGNYIVRGCTLYHVKSPYDGILSYNCEEGDNFTFSPNQKFVISYRYNSSINIYNINSSKPMIEIPVNAFNLKFMKKGKEILAIGGIDKGYKLSWIDFDTYKVKEIFNVYLDNHEITSFEISDDGKYMITGSDDNIVRLWDLETQKCIGKLEGHTLKINDVAISPDNKFALSAGNDGLVKLWDLSKIIESYAKTTPIEPPKLITEPDIAQNLPKARKKNEDAIAVVIGNQNYSKTKKVDYALHDARLMKKYLIETLGYKEGNILYQENADLGTMQTIFGTKENREGKLANIVKSSSDIFVYYSGHGAPDMTGKERTAYFVPVECDPSFVAMGGYSLNTLYQNLSTLKVRSITVVLDACFSGEGIIDNISPVFIKPAKPHLRENFAVFASCEGEQVSCWHNEKQQGLFTYFFLKAIHNKNADANEDRILTLQEIQQYIADKTKGVPYEARRLHNKMQNPQLWWNGKDRDFMRYED